MITRLTVARKHFVLMAERAFGPVLEAHGLKKERRKWSNSFAVAFVNASSRLYVEGIHWGGSARASVGSSGTSFEDYDVLDVLGLCCPAIMPTDAQLKGQEEALERLADCSMKCPAVGTIMRGDFGLFPRLDEVREQRIRESRERLASHNRQ